MASISVQAVEYGGGPNAVDRGPCRVANPRRWTRCWWKRPRDVSNICPISTQSIMSPNNWPSTGIIIAMCSDTSIVSPLPITLSLLQMQPWVFWHDDNILDAYTGVSCHSYVCHCKFGFMQIRVIFAYIFGYMFGYMQIHVIFANLHICIYLHICVTAYEGKPLL